MENTSKDQQSKEILKDKFIGCLLGGAIGDALGFATEFLSFERIRAKYGRLTDYKIKPTWGYYTDDTQLTIALAETLVKCNGFNKRDFSSRLAKWWTVFPRLSGRGTKNAALKCFLGFKNTGCNAPGSSGAMRMAPLALFYYDDRDALFKKTVECCEVTHNHPAAVAGALVSAFSIAYCLTHTELDEQAYLNELADIAEPFDPKLAKRLLSLTDKLDWPGEEVIKELLKHSSKTRFPIFDIIPTAIYAFLKYPHDYENCVLFCVNAGWDTDTTAAIAGNTSGAWNGYSNIPQRWIANLERSYKGRDYIMALAQSLYQKQPVIKPMNFVFDYAGDWWRNVCFLFNMILRKPMW